MMDCNTVRRAILADPRAASPELTAHLESCAACAAYVERVLLFETRLERALEVVPPARAARVLPFKRRELRLRGGWLAAAASVLIVLAMSSGVWLVIPHASLAADVVAHVAGEPQAWARTDAPVPSAQLARALRAAHVRLAPGAPMVSYAQSCWFRGHFVPHLVVQTDHGPVTVMVLVHEPVARPVPFDEGGYRGILVPDPGHGSLAVLARDHGADLKSVEATAARVEQALIWNG